MGSITISGIMLQNATLRSYGRNFVLSSGTNPFGQSTSSRTIEGPPIYDMVCYVSGVVSGVLYETISGGPGIKVAESVYDSMIRRNISGVVPTSGSYDTLNQTWVTNLGVRIPVRDSLNDTLTSRASNSGVY